MPRRYLRYAALGDSSTFGIGDPVRGPDGRVAWRGFATLLAEALASGYHLSYCNTAVPGATATAVRADQLSVAVDHRPHLASLVVGLNDTMRSTWEPDRLREDLLECAAALCGAGATLITVRFHDHGAVFGLPGVLRRPLGRRIDAVNAAYDEVHARFGGHRIDLSVLAAVAVRTSWSVDRLHPSELGHRVLARACADELLATGLQFEPPALEASGGDPRCWHRDLAWVVGRGAPWVGRRARDLGPWAVRLALAETRRPRVPAAH